MIANERQYRGTAKQADALARALTDARRSRPRPSLDPRIHAAMVDGIEGELQELRRQLRRYESVKAGTVTTRRLRGLADLPDALIEGRISRNWSHRDLAARLGVAEQQVQRYERQRYATASLATLVRIADVLGIELHPEVTFGGREHAA